MLHMVIAGDTQSLRTLWLRYKINFDITLICQKITKRVMTLTF